jgi:cytoskeletal protein RodZ
MTKADLIQVDENAVSIGIGTSLRLRREELVWSIDEAVRKTGIPKHSIIAIELENFHVFLDNAAILDSYIRLYAKKLGLSLKVKEHLIAKAKNSLKPGKPGMEFINEVKLGR